jgi:hypothetical protein
MIGRNKTKAFTWITVSLLAFVLLAGPGCYGKFNLTRQVYAFNTNLGSKWVNEIIFILLSPVYGFTMLGDTIIFNSFEFWGGDNPVSEPAVAIKGPADLAE